MFLTGDDGIGFRQPNRGLVEQSDHFESNIYLAFFEAVNLLNGDYLAHSLSTKTSIRFRSIVKNVINICHLFASQIFNH